VSNKQTSFALRHYASDGPEDFANSLVPLSARMQAQGLDLDLTWKGDHGLRSLASNYLRPAEERSVGQLTPQPAC
jgi:hypothetical protein